MSSKNTLNQKAIKQKDQQLFSFRKKFKSRNLGVLLSTTMLLCMSTYQAKAQKAKKLVKVSEFYQTLSGQSSHARGIKSSEKTFTLSTARKNVNAKINSYHQAEGNESFMGSIENSKNSVVYFNIKNSLLHGKVIIPSEKKSYVYQTNAWGEVEVQEEDINNAFCVDYGIKKTNHKSLTNARATTIPPALSPVYNLQSLPSANVVLMLDFDGEYVTNTQWNNGTTAIDALPNNFDETAINEIWKLVSEDFRAFNINVTTSNAVFLAANPHKRMKCIFTSNTNIASGANGVAFGGSFYWPTEQPCWVFSGQYIEAAETASHELGHTLGLAHDGTSTKPYYPGGYGWEPIMGVGLHPSLVQWSNGEYPDANNQEDDINIIANTPFYGDNAHVIGFRTDEAGNTLATAKLLSYAPNGDISETNNVGIISERTDVDVYSFNTTGGTASINVLNTSIYANLDIQLIIKNSAGNVISSTYSKIDQATSLDASFAGVLPAGTYYIIIDGVGKGDPLTTNGGYSDYASLGQYKITGNIIANTAPAVTLSHIANYGSFTTSTAYKTPGSIRLSASATDIEGPISKVEFYQGSVKIGEDNLYPSFEWYLNNLPAGIYTFTAKAYDQTGLNTESAPISFIVDAVAPTINLSSPTVSPLVAPASIYLIASVNDQEGPIKNVEFYQNNVKIGEDGLYPSFNWSANNLPAGTYTFTAKAYDQAGWATTSAPLVFVVNDPCLLSEATPPATQFVLRNNWYDQNAGASVSNEAGALKVTQRAYGQNELWVLETQKLISVTNGQAYNIKFDFKDFQSIGVAGIDVAFATGINTNGNGPTITGSIVSFPAGYSSTNFTTKSANITSSYTGSVFIAIKLRWPAQPPLQVINYIKNLMVCIGTSTQSRDVAFEQQNTEVEFSGISISPNPSETAFNTFVSKDVASVQITDLQGNRVFSSTSAAKNTTLNFGETFQSGLYIANIQYVDGTKEVIKIAKIK